MYIIGAGYTGLLAAVAFPKATILEARSGPFENHQALLRFRSNYIGDMLNIPFRPVTVLKSIWLNGEQRPSPRMSNLYSRKVTGEYHTRSISNIDSVTRYIAPRDLYDQLLELVGDRIKWGAKVQFMNDTHISLGANVINRDGQPILATLPMQNTISACSLGVSPDFRYSPISTYRANLKPCSEAFSTVYYPSPDFPFYRASITENLLICEMMGGDEVPQSALHTVAHSLGLLTDDIEWKQEFHKQKYGKIAPIDEGVRRQIIYQLTNKFGIYSVGRFGTWRNILLDDVYNDIKRIKELIRMGDYERRMEQV
jgi:hypothetical protein